MMGSRISARTPLSYLKAWVLRTCFTMTGSDTTINDRGPNISLYTWEGREGGRGEG